jgi:serine protease
MIDKPSRRRPAARTLRAALLVPTFAAAVVFPAAAAAAPNYVPHEVIVGYAPRAVASRRATARMHTMVLSAVSASPRPRPRASAAPAPRSQVVRLPEGESVTTAIARLRRQPGVAYAVPNYIAHAAGAWYPNDRGRTNRPQGWEKTQWNLLNGNGISAPEAWWNLLVDHHPGGRGVTVAILDTGVAYRNWRGFRQSPDFRGTRFVSPYDFVNHNRFPLDRNGHGTFVAGVVAEATNNGFGLTGVAYGASVMPVRVLDAGGLGDETTIAQGIRYAVNHHAQVINLSLEFLPDQVSSGSAIPQIVSALNYAHRRGVTVVGAAGNDEDSQIAYPARVRTVISVGATTSDGCLADYSNGGTGLDLVAPGGGSDAIMPTDPNCNPDRNLPSIYQLTLTDPPHWDSFGYPGYYIGTSMSSPEVAGTAALMIASGVIGRHPSPQQILARLEETATALGGRKPNHNYGYGLLNAGAATSRVAVAAAG